MRRILQQIQVEHAVDHQVLARGRRFYLDFAYPHLKIGIEAHSIRWHMGTEKVKEDMARHRSLVMDGWLMLYYSWDDATPRRAEVEQEIRDAIAMRSPQLSLLR
jgi:very-short-patch-repair endonuclease